MSYKVSSFFKIVYRIAGNFREAQAIRENIIRECCTNVLFFVHKERAIALIRENNYYSRNALSRAFAKIFSHGNIPLYGMFSLIKHDVNKCCFCLQIGSLSVSTTSANVDHLLVSQAGGTYIPLCYTREEEGGEPRLTQGQTVGRVQRNSQSSSTEVIGDLHTHEDFVEGASHCNTVALCTLDGKHRVSVSCAGHDIFDLNF